MRVNQLGRGALLSGLLAAAACGHMSRYQKKFQGDGSYRIDCNDRLSQCLTAIEEACLQGYEIVQAQEDVRYLGPREFNQPTVTSFVVARCRTPKAVFGDLKTSTSTPEAPAPAKPAATPVCVPGATQACVGPGACQGGQRCLADGTAFGPCDCGEQPAVTPLPDAAGPR